MRYDEFSFFLQKMWRRFDYFIFVFVFLLKDLRLFWISRRSSINRISFSEKKYLELVVIPNPCSGDRKPGAFIMRSHNNQTLHIDTLKMRQGH